MFLTFDPHVSNIPAHGQNASTAGIIRSISLPVININKRTGLPVRPKPCGHIAQTESLRMNGTTVVKGKVKPNAHIA